MTNDKKGPRKKPKKKRKKVQYKGDSAKRRSIAMKEAKQQ